jgi:hypothetical protein
MHAANLCGLYEQTRNIQLTVASLLQAMHAVVIRWVVMYY